MGMKIAEGGGFVVGRSFISPSSWLGLFGDSGVMLLITSEQVGVSNKSQLKGTYGYGTWSPFLERYIL